MFWTSRFLLAVTFFTIGMTFTHADQPKEKSTEENIDKKSMTDLIVVLQDEDGKPVEGAAVMAYAMRMDGGWRIHGYWNPEKLGPPKSVISDKDGRAVARYPAKVGSTPHTKTTSSVSFSVSHYEVRQASRPLRSWTG